jgi:acyl-coenzyme A thioesterase PaaI-like protein
LKLNYLAPLSTGRMIGRGKSLRVGKTLCLGEASVVSEEGNLLVHGTSTMMILKDLKVEGAEHFPPKYLD